MNERFQFLRTYLDSLEKLAQADEQLAKDLAWKIIQYWIKWENEDSWNPIIEAMFVQIRLMIDNWIEMTNKNRENGKKWWRPIKTWENSQKPNPNPNITQTKPNDNPNETEPKPKKTKIENRKEKIENIITLSNDNEWDKSHYWNEEINKCLELIKNYNNGLVDWTQQNQRRYAKHLINKLNWLENVKKWKFTWYQTLDILLKVISQNKFYSAKISSPEKIYRELWTLMNVCRNDIQSKSTGNVILETL